MVQKAFATLIIIAFLIPNTVAIYRGSENFPFTACPMFAHYIGDHTQMYNFEFIGRQPDGTRVILTPQYGADSEMMSRRFFFSKVYGSVDCPSSFGNFCDDTPQNFEERLGQYFTAYLAALPEDSEPATDNLRRIDLEVWRYDGNDTVTEKHQVGYYRPETQTFTHTWQPD